MSYTASAAQGGGAVITYQMYRLLGTVLLISCGVFLALSVVLFIFFKIKSVICDLSGPRVQFTERSCDVNRTTILSAPTEILKEDRFKIVKSIMLVHTDEKIH